MWVDDPGAADTPTVFPFRSSIAAHRRRHQHQPRIPQHRHEGSQVLALRGHLNRVVVKSANDIGAAAHQRFERLGTARKIEQRDVEPGILVISELRGQRHRQIN